MKNGVRFLLLILFASAGISAHGEAKTGYVDGNAPDAKVTFGSEAADVYSLSASASGGWVFTEEFNYPNSNGWIAEPASYRIVRDRIQEGEIYAFLDAATQFSATISGRMYLPGGENGSTIAWSVTGVSAVGLNPYLDPATGIFPVGGSVTETYEYKRNGYFPEGKAFWKQQKDGVVYQNWTLSGATLVFPSANHPMGAYVLSAAQNAGDRYIASAEAKVVAVKSVTATAGENSVTSTTDTPGANQTLYVAKGDSKSSITVTAAPEPGSAWPANHPTWKLNNSAAGTAGSVTYSLSTATAGTYTVSATCGTSTKKIKIVALELTHETDVTSPTNRQRTKLGVGEKVKLTISPTISGSASWSTSEGTISGSDNSATFTAPSRSATATVTATINNCSLTKTFTVVEPNGVLMERTGNIRHTQGLPSTGMQLYIYIQPTDVSFNRIEVREGTCAPVSTGYFELINVGNHPNGNFITMTSSTINDKGTLALGLDTAQISLSTLPPANVRLGTTTWPIPWLFKVTGESEEKEFSVVNQVAGLDIAGGMSISKGGASVYSALDAPTTNF